MDNKEVKKKWSEYKVDDLPWKAWGSWFSWGSPVGMGLGWALFAVSTGILIYLLHLSGIIR